MRQKNVVKQVDASATAKLCRSVAFLITHSLHLFKQ
jgi:hypothetical protein